jgi:hypothetical protein
VLVLVPGDLGGELADGLALERDLVAAFDRAALALAGSQAGRQPVPVDGVGVELRLEVLQVEREVEDRAVRDGGRIGRSGGRGCLHAGQQARADQAKPGGAGGPEEPAAVAYVDPGNFATNFAAGAGSGYRLLWVIVMANLMAVLIQYLTSKAGLATGRSLPELCRERYGTRVNVLLWLQAEVVAMATDLAEFDRTARAGGPRFHLPAPRRRAHDDAFTDRPRARRSLNLYLLCAAVAGAL